MRICLVVAIGLALGFAGVAEAGRPPTVDELNAALGGFGHDWLHEHGGYPREAHWETADKGRWEGNAVVFSARGAVLPRAGAQSGTYYEGEVWVYIDDDGNLKAEFRQDRDSPGGISAKALHNIFPIGGGSTNQGWIQLGRLSMSTQQRKLTPGVAGTPARTAKIPIPTSGRVRITYVWTKTDATSGGLSWRNNGKTNFALWPGEYVKGTTWPDNPSIGTLVRRQEERKVGRLPNLTAVLEPLRKAAGVGSAMNTELAGTQEVIVEFSAEGLPPPSSTPTLPAPPGSQPATPAPAQPAPIQPTPTQPAPPGHPPNVGGLQVGTGTASDGSTSGVADHFPQAGTLRAKLNFQNQRQGAVAVAVWTRDGQQVMRSQQALGGPNGSVSFTYYTQRGGGLPAGTYTLTITVDGQVLGRKTFTIGQTGQSQNPPPATPQPQPTQPAPTVPAPEAASGDGYIMDKANALNGARAGEIGTVLEMLRQQEGLDLFVVLPGTVSSQQAALDMARQYRNSLVAARRLSEQSGVIVYANGGEIMAYDRSPHCDQILPPGLVQSTWQDVADEDWPQRIMWHLGFIAGELAGR